jgi:hypothetical protein
MHVFMPKLINCPTPSPPVVPLLPWNSFSLMYGDWPLIPLGARNIMLVLLMITASLHGFICFIINLSCLNPLLNFNLLLNACLIAKFLQFNPTGVVSMRSLIPFSALSALHTMSRAHMPTNKMVPLNTSTVISLRRSLPCCHISHKLHPPQNCCHLIPQFTAS